MFKVILTRPTIIQVISYYPPHLGGMENVAMQIVEGFVNKKYAMYVYTYNVDYLLNTIFISKSRIHYLKSIEFAHTPILFILFFRLFALPRYSLIHLHVAQAFSPGIVYLISKLKEIPYIAHIHLDVDPSGLLGFLLGTYKKFFLKRVLKSAAKLICVSEAQKRVIASKYTLPLESIAVIPKGVAEKYFVGKKASENTVLHLLFVGRLAAQKNPSVIIEAVSQMQKSVFLDIVGEGEQRKDIEALIQKHKMRNAILRSKNADKDLIKLYESVGVFLLPSLKEAGTSLSMFEAMAASLPVVASDTPEVGEILADCSILIQDPTAINYAKTLDTLLSNENILQKLRILSIQKACSYSWKNLLDSIEDIYQEIKS